MSGIEARLHLRRGAFTLDADVRLPGTGVTAVFGPSGSGKSTLLRCLAGLEAGARGTVRLGDRVWQGEQPRRFVPPHRRGVGYVFQEADLFAHLDVRGNLEYARRRAASARVAMDDAVAWLGLASLLHRRPAGLSGGERQRVAIARALLAGPRLLLMDEPLSALDEVGRREILGYLEALPGRLDVPIVYVSHSLREVLRLADHMVWMLGGTVRASGSPAAVVRQAGFAAWQGDEAGVVVEARVVEHDEAHALTRMEGPWGPLWTRRHPAGPGARVRLRIRAGDVSLGLDDDPRSSILNQFPLQVREVTDGDPGEVLVRLGAPGTDAVLLARITGFSRTRLGIVPGTEVFARVKSVAVLD